MDINKKFEELYEEYEKEWHEGHEPQGGHDHYEDIGDVEELEEARTYLDEKTYYNLERGVYEMGKEKHDRKKEVKQGYPNAIEVKSTVKQAAATVAKLNKEEVELSEKGTAYPATVDTLKQIVKDKQHQTVMFDKGNAKVDLFTASAMMAVYNALKQPALKKKFEDMIKSKEGFMQTQAFAMKMAK